MYPPRKDPITNQDNNTLDIETDQSLPPHVPPLPPGFKSLRKDANYDNTETTGTSYTEKYDTSRTNRDDYI